MPPNGAACSPPCASTRRSAAAKSSSSWHGRSARSSGASAAGDLIHQASTPDPDTGTSHPVMSSVSETIVREYFELHEFLVRQHRKYIAQTKREEDDIDFFVFNPKARSARVGGAVCVQLARPAVRRTRDRGREGLAHGNLQPAVISHAPEIFRFVEPKAFQQAARAFARMPPDEDPRRTGPAAGPGGARPEHRPVAGEGVDAAIPFRTMLADLVSRIEVNRNYQKSDLLQMIRILKNYDFFKEPQLDLFKGARRKR